MSSSVVAHDVRPTSARPRDEARPPVRRSLPAEVVPFAVFLVVQGLQIAVLHRLVPRFFWLDDSQVQFGPMAWWLGRNLEGGVPPLADPDQGIAGNVTSDMQYGVFDPLHWLLVWVLGANEDVLTMAWQYGSICMAVLGLGVLALLRYHRVPAVWAVAAAVGVSAGGFFLWYGSTWWPLMWGSAWLPWLWLGLATRRWPGVLLTGVATWALLASGNPYSLPFGLVIVVAQTVEHVRQAGGVRAAFADSRLWTRALACVGGAVIAVPTLLNALEVAGHLQRPGPEGVIGNAGTQVPNVADTVLGGATLLGQTNAFNGPIGLVPALATFLLAVPLLPLVRWRAALRAPGVPTALALTVAAVLATQLPTVVFLFRYPFRYLVVVQIALPVLAVLALAAARSTSRPRVLAAFGLVGLQFLFAAFRAPLLLPWHVVAAAVTAVALAAFLALLREPRPGRRAVTAVVVLLATAATPFLGVATMVDVRDRLAAVGAPVTQEGLPYRDIGAPGQSGSDALGRTVEEFRERSIVTDETVTVYAWNPYPAVFGLDRGWGRGFFPGNANLLAGASVGTGYVTSGHRFLSPYLCPSYVGSLGCPDPSSILSTVPGTDRPWLDVLSSDSVVLSSNAPAEVAGWFRDNWRATGADENWSRFERPEAERLPGRVAALDGVAVAPTGWTAGLARIGEPQDAYTVTTGGSAGTVLLRVPHWPGYRATVDGQEVEVGAREGALVEVTVPAGVTDGRLELYFDPIGARLLPAALTAGPALVLLAALAAVVAERRARRRTAAPAGPPTAAA